MFSYPRLHFKFHFVACIERYVLRNERYITTAWSMYIVHTYLLCICARTFDKSERDGNLREKTETGQIYHHVNTKKFSSVASYALYDYVDVATSRWYINTSIPCSLRSISLAHGRSLLYFHLFFYLSLSLAHLIRAILMHYPCLSHALRIVRAHHRLLCQDRIRNNEIR